MRHYRTPLPHLVLYVEDHGAGIPAGEHEKIFERFYRRPAVNEMVNVFVRNTLLIADLGPTVTSSVVAQLRSQLASRDVHTEADARVVLREVLIAELQPGLDRSVRALPHDDHPSVLLVVARNANQEPPRI